MAIWLAELGVQYSSFAQLNKKSNPKDFVAVVLNSNEGLFEKEKDQNRTSTSKKSVLFSTNESNFDLPKTEMYSMHQFYLKMVKRKIY